MIYEEYGRLMTKLNLSRENMNNHLIMASFYKKSGCKTTTILYFFNFLDQ